MIFSVTGVSLFLMCAMMAMAWHWQRRQRNASIVDPLWAFGLAATGLAHALAGPGAVLPRTLLGTITVLWFGRLGGYLLLRMQGQPEDSRYRTLRDHLGSPAQGFWFLFFQSQALLAWLLSLTFREVATNSSDTWSFHYALAVVIAIVAFTGETMADRQLHAFKADPENRGRTCKVGLWRYTRHPNYFFEWLHWLAYPLLAWGTTHGVWTWLAPALMLLLLLKVTGVPHAERQALQHRRNDYAEYQKTTNVFFPWKPKL